MRLPVVGLPPHDPPDRLIHGHSSIIGEEHVSPPADRLESPFMPAHQVPIEPSALSHVRGPVPEESRGKLEWEELLGH